MDPLAVRSRVKCILVEVLELNIEPEQIGDEELLFEGRLGMNSLVAVELLSAIEEDFGIEIKDESIDLDLFRSVKTLSDEIMASSPKK